jgi:hypothetical protein
MKFLLAVLFALHLCKGVEAQTYTSNPDVPHWQKVEKRVPLPSLLEEDDKVRTFGINLDIGVPDGISPGISIHPGTNVLHLDLAVSSILSIGVRGGVTLDPFDWVIAPTLTVTGGHNFKAKIPDMTGMFDYSYVSTQLGLEFGRRSRFRVYLRGGYSRLWANTYNASGQFKLVGVTVTEPHVTADLLPSVSAGINAFF